MRRVAGRVARDVKGPPTRQAKRTSVQNTCQTTVPDQRPELASRVDTAIARRLAAVVRLDRCQARTFKLTQCEKTGGDVNGIRLCKQHFASWHKHGLMGSELSAAHKQDVQ